ncbi:MAG TPA: aldo/keto reductase [Pseudomonadales bacterium]|nr:aldo/keto reductase [Pseudomonadales bacterium]
MSLRMPRRPLGDTGIEVSVLGLGTVKFGRTQGLKYPQPFTIPDNAQAARLLATARDLGINLLDTAPAYGNAELRLGALLRGQRQDWVIVTKTGERFEQGVSRFDFSPEHTRASVMRSLGRLDTDWLDCVLVHSDGDDLGILRAQGTLEVLQDLKAEGVIRAFGISTKTLAGGLAALAHCDVVMVTLNMDETEDLPVVTAAHRRGRGVLVKKALGSGHLAATAATQLRWVTSRPGVSAAVVGSIDAAHLRDDAEAVAVGRL